MGPCEASGEATERIRNYFYKPKTKLDLTMAIKVIAQKREVKLGKNPGMKCIDLKVQAPKRVLCTQE